MSNSAPTGISELIDKFKVAAPVNWAIVNTVFVFSRVTAIAAANAADKLSALPNGYLIMISYF
jgi:hypothetical protein